MAEISILPGSTPGAATSGTPVAPAAAIKERLRSGLSGESSVMVDEHNTAEALGSGSVPVFGTPAMAALVEAAAVNAVGDVLGEDQTTVGVSLDLQHLAATPVGMTVTARVELVAVEGRKLTFQVACRGGGETIGAGRHERMVIDLARFEARVATKAANLPS